MRGGPDVIESRGPGSLVHNSDTGVSGCLKCGWRGVPTTKDDGETDHRCPSCEIAPATDEEYAAMVRPIVRTEPKIGRNDPCHCGSGRKFKKCHGR